VLTTTNAAGTIGFTCLSKHGGAQTLNFWSPIYRERYLSYEHKGNIQSADMNLNSTKTIERENKNDYDTNKLKSSQLMRIYQIKHM
jgi:hypothetical protein